MKSSSETILRKAKSMFKNSFSGNEIKEEKVRALIKGLIVSKRRDTIDILKKYRKLVQNFLDEKTALVESGQELDSGEKESVKALLTDIYKRKLEFVFFQNKALVGGMQIKVGDTIWDASLKGKLLALREIYE